MLRTFTHTAAVFLLSASSRRLIRAAQLVLCCSLRAASIARCLGLLALQRTVLSAQLLAGASGTERI
jgi:hypothetical protein